MRRFIAACGLVVFAFAAQAADLKLMANNAVREPLAARVAAFEQASGHKVAIAWGGSEGIARRVADGEAADAVLIASSNIDRLIADGKLAGPRAGFARVGVGVAVRDGLPKPDISSADALKKALLEAKSIAYSTGPSGFYIVELMRKLGVADQVKDRIVQPPSGAQVGELIARGEAEFGFQQVSELMHVKGIQYLGPLPPEIQNVTIYAIARHAGSANAEAVQALVAFLTAPETAPLLQRVGMEPGK